MKLKLLLLALIATTFSVSAQKRICPSHDILHQQEAADPTIKQNREEIEKFTANFVKNFNDGDRATYNIPVVVHVLYNTAAQNISDAQIQSQINVLNLDYQLLNTDNTSVPAAFASLKANVSVSFCLAKQDANGAATTGIIRKSTTKTAFDANTDDAKSSTTGGDNAWDRNKYLNLWIVPSIKAGTSTGILGYAQFPGGAAATDGVVIGYKYFGTNGTASAPFNKGRTATHEVGHWLNLNHIWGDDGTACTGTDNVADTPNQAGENYGCPTFPKVSCSNGPNGDMFMNYMDYTDDACMFMFSTGQKARMQAVLAAGGARASLNTSIGCNAPSGGGTTCAAPTGLASSAITSSGATLSWAAVTGATSYTLQYKTSAATTFTTVSGLTSATYTLTGLAASTAYNFQVASVCSATSTSAYTASTFTTAAVVVTCSDIYEPNNTLATSSALTVGATANAAIGIAGDLDYYSFSNTAAQKNIKITLNVTGKDYDIRLYNSAGTQVKLQASVSNPEILIYNTTVVGAYKFRIEGYNNAFSTTACYTVKVETGASNFRGTKEEENQLLDSDVNVFPNPSNGELNIQLPEEKFNRDMDLMLVNSIGQVVMTKKFGENQTSTLNMNNLSNGIYFLQIRDVNTVINKRVILEK
jgi:Pregnancy-associated plasma protein-A/Secretion system C-terminal sorting domain/Fibronectin type III domain